MYRIYNFCKDEIVCKYNSIFELLNYLNIRSDIQLDECYIQFYDGDINEWEIF